MIFLKMPPKTSKLRSTLAQLFAVFVKNLYLLCLGSALGFTAIFIPAVKNNKDGTFKLNAQELSWIASLSNLSLLIGCIFSGFVTEPIGRKKSMQISTLPFVAFWFLISFSYRLWHIYLSIGVIGFCNGISKAPVMLYIAEVTEPNLRGWLSCTSTFCVLIGILSQFFVGSFTTWRTLARVNGIYPIFVFALLLLIPESPYWYVMNGKNKQAKNSLAWVNGWVDVENVQEEFNSLVEYYRVIRPENSKHSKFLERSFLHPIFILTVLFIPAYFGGYVAITSFPVVLMDTFQVPYNKYHAVNFLGIAQFMGSIFYLIMVKRKGKRFSVLLSLIMCCVSCSAIGIYSKLMHQDQLLVNDSNNNDTLGWIPFGILIWLSFSVYGVLPICFGLIGELFSGVVRNKGAGFVCAIGFFNSFLANKTFIQLTELINVSGTFWFYSVICLIGTVFAYYFLPETEGKTLQEISDHFRGISKLSVSMTKRRTQPKREEIQLMDIN